MKEEKTSKPENEDYANHIAVVREVLEEILDEKEKQFVLFGERNFFKANKRNYDIIFHALPNIPFNELKAENARSLIVPVVPFEKDEDNTIIGLYELNKMHPLFDTFAVKGYTEPIALYRISEKSYGRIIDTVAGACMTKKEMLEKVIDKADEFKKDIEGSISRINLRYSPEQKPNAEKLNIQSKGYVLVSKEGIKKI